MIKTIKIFSLAFLLTLSACATSRHAALEGQHYFNKHAYPQAFKALLPAAKHGDADAQYALGYMYYYGYGIGRDVKLAEYWFREGAKQGQGKAIAALSMIDNAKMREH